MKYYSIGEFADKIGKTIQTLRNWDKNNTFKPAYVTTGVQDIILKNNLIIF